MKEVAEDYAKQLGVDFVCVSADDDVTKQNNDINDMISSGINALILNPINAEGVAPAIEACQKADIPVITVDRNVNDGNTFVNICPINSDVILEAPETTDTNNT